MTTYPLTTLEHIKSTTIISWPSVLRLLVSFCCCCQLAAQLCAVYLFDIMPEITQICSTDFKRKETASFLHALFASSSPHQQMTVMEQRPPCNRLPSRRHSSTIPACWSVFWTQEVFAGLYLPVQSFHRIAYGCTFKTETTTCLLNMNQEKKTHSPHAKTNKQKHQNTHKQKTQEAANFDKPTKSTISELWKTPCLFVIKLLNRSYSSRLPQKLTKSMMQAHDVRFLPTEHKINGVNAIG